MYKFAVKGGVKKKRMARAFLQEAGVDEKQLPDPLKDVEIARSRDGVIGRISVTRFSGVRRNQTAKIIDDFEERVGLDQILEALSLSPTKGIQKLVEISKQPGKHMASLKRLIADAEVDPASVFTHYAKGMLLAKRAEAVAVAAEGAPHSVRELLRLAAPMRAICRTCLGVGKIPKSTRHNEATEPCPTCMGKKEMLESGPLQEFAIKELNQIVGLIEKTPGVQVNQQTNIQQNTQVVGGGFAHRLLTMNDKLLRAPKMQPTEIQEAEVVQSEDN